MYLCLRCGSERLRVDSTMRYIKFVPTLSIPIVYIGCAECDEHMAEVDLPDLLQVMDLRTLIEGVLSADRLDHRLAR
jgi:hypothetical protein